MLSMLKNLRQPYSGMEAWAYDRLVAPAARALAEGLIDEALAQVPPEALVLDVGCGGGQTGVLLLERRPDLRWRGVDLSHPQVARARARTRRFGARAEAVQGSALALPFEPACFDVVLSIASIKHWPDPLRGLSECVRVLRPGGLLAVVEADRGCRHEDAVAFVAAWRIPRLVRPLALALFRTVVVGQAFDLDDARALWAQLPVGGGVSRVAGAPVLQMVGIREPG